MSSIQEPVSTLPAGMEEISRADECRLLYLGNDKCYNIPPLCPFALFGSTAIIDTDLDVRQHAQSGADYSLEYESLIWRCRGSHNPAISFPKIPLRVKDGRPTYDNISVNYGELDNEGYYRSESVTRNTFCWLRDGGFPISERAIREHESIDNFDSEDGEPITYEGDALSTAGGKVHSWLLKSMIRRSHSI
jgi:hypothetical protein